MFNNVFGFTFYALDLKQISLDLINKFGKVEAILFSEKDLEEKKWEEAWNNISKVSNTIGSSNISFHFPMDNCDYINSAFIKERLIDAIERANILGIHKIVVHPNLRYKINEWIYIDRLKMQNTLFSFINDINKGTVDICLENMPPIGNQYDDADSAVLFATDINENIDYTWDICHYFNVVKTMAIANSNTKWKNILADIQECKYLDFTKYLKNIKHYHFSAFKNIANPFLEQPCIEGILPNESCVEEKYYKEALKVIYADAIKNNKSIIFEISEENYYDRKNILEMLKWAKEVIEEVI